MNLSKGQNIIHMVGNAIRSSKKTDQRDQNKNLKTIFKINIQKVKILQKLKNPKKKISPLDP
jgi:hypothetical protein